eukprot:jgi/Ulvmu1/10803/UM069_0039.1
MNAGVSAKHLKLARLRSPRYRCPPKVVCTMATTFYPRLMAPDVSLLAAANNYCRLRRLWRAAWCDARARRGGNAMALLAALGGGRHAEASSHLASSDSLCQTDSVRTGAARIWPISISAYLLEQSLVT